MIRVEDITSTADLAHEDLIDLRELLELRDGLRYRALCENCGDPAHETPEGTVVHDETGRTKCTGEEGAAGYVAELSDMLDTDELALLAELERFDRDEVYGDLHDPHGADSPTLIAERCWRDYAEEDANELILQDANEQARAYFDYERFADDYRQDFEEVTLAGTTFLRRSF